MALETFEHTVTVEDTAARLGSGDLQVLATPRMINWLERAAYTVAKANISAEQTTVGTLVKVEHLKGTPVGRRVRVTCSKPVNDGRRLIFHVTALDDDDDELARGEIHRRVVDPERFMARFEEEDRQAGDTGP
ncbi:MAG: thioesterase [Dermatophilaceae bacterium]